MIAPSGLYRIPRAETSSRTPEVLRYARLEYGAPSLAWMHTAAPASPGMLNRLAAGLASIFGRPQRQLTPSTAPRVPLRTGSAAVHLAGEFPHGHPSGSGPHVPASWDSRPSAALVLPALEVDERVESCECQP